MTERKRIQVRKFWTVSQLVGAGRLLPSITVRQAQRLIRSGAIKATNVGAGTVPRWLISDEEVRRFEASRNG